MKKKYALTIRAKFGRRRGYRWNDLTAMVIGFVTFAGMTIIGYAGDEGKKEVMPAPQASGHYEESMDEGWWTGPLIASSATALPMGHFLIEPYFTGAIDYGRYNGDWDMKRSPHNTYTADTHWLISYGLLPNFTVSAVPGAKYKWTHDGDSNLQVSDLQVRAQYMFHKFKGKGDLWPTISLMVGEFFPTGEYENLGDRPQDGIGNGTYTTRLGLWTQYFYWLPNGRILRQRFNVTANIPTGDVKVRNVSVYNTKEGFNGHVSVGNSYTFDLSYEYSLTSHWVPVIEFVYTHTEGNHLSGIEPRASGLGGFNRVRNGSAPSEYFEIDPAIEYNFNSKIGIIAGAQISFAGRNKTATVIPQFAVNLLF
jgi:hypothetical protein